MYSKYGNKTYTQGIQNEVSDSENESKKIIKNNNMKCNNTDTEQDTFIKTTFQPKCIFTKQNNNISFYQSTSKNSYRPSKNNKNINPDSCDKNSVTLKKPSSGQFQIYGEEKFSYNYTALDKNSINKSKDKNNNYLNNERVNLNEQQLSQNFKKPKRTIKTYKKQFNMEKSDNFNVLSYRPLELESDINVINNKDKQPKIQVYKKQEVDEMFFPSKRTHSPQLNKDVIEKYQTHTLKYQSFFGSFNGSKKSHMAKSTSKIKTNQLNDFNIDKLIEIGDKYASNNPVLPLGKIMNNNIMYRSKYNKNKIPINHKSYNHNNYTKNVNNNIKGLYIFSSHILNNKNKDIEELGENSVNLLKEKKRVTKKIISKNNVKNTRTYDDNREQIIKDSTVKKNLNFNTETDKIDKKITGIKLKKRQMKRKTKNSISQQNKTEYNDEDKTFQDIIPIKKNSKKKTFISINMNQKENIENNKIFEKNSVRNDKQKNDLVERKLLTDDEGNFKNNNSQMKMDKISKMNNNTQGKEIIINENKKYKSNKILGNIYFYKDNKPKMYYGYDERHNLEDTINNHAYYESIHSKKKITNRSFNIVV